MGTLLVVPYIPATDNVGNRVTSRMPVVTADALMAILLVDAVVIRPYWSTDIIGTLEVDPYDAGVTDEVGSLSMFKEPEVTADASIDTLHVVAQVMRPY